MNTIKPQITYRENVCNDDTRIVRSIVESTGFFSVEETDIAVELVEERLKRGAASGYHFLFAETNGQAVGYTCFGRIGCTQASYDLYWIVVHNNLRGQGLGKQLLKRSEEIIRSMNGKRVYLETSSRSQYLSTRQFYLNTGYTVEAILDDFYAPGDDKVIFLKVL